MPRAPRPSTPLTLSTSASRKVRAPAPKKKSKSSKATFTFSADETGQFTCKLDKGSAKPCDSGVKYKGLKAGKHTFTVFGTDDIGNDGSSTTFKWKVKKKKG